MAGERWDFYEITFSMLDTDDQIDAALNVYEAVTKMSGVTGASFSGGDVADRHPFSKADVERGAEALIAIAKRWGMGDWQPTGARELAETVLIAATNPALPSPRIQDTPEEGR